MSNNLPISINNIEKSFGSQKVLHNISFTVNPGEIFGLIGLNGVGKTTLIKILLDLLDTDLGHASFFGIDVNEPMSRKNIAYLPEKFYPSQFLKGEEFLSLSLSYYNKSYDKEIAANLASTLDLDPKVLSHKISKYSKGMGQKLGLLSVFLSEVPLLILDEPMSGLDPSARIQLKTLLNDYVKHDKTIFFTSHILSDIDEICNRIAVIDRGHLIYVGSPAGFREKYKGDNLERSFLNAISLPEPDVTPVTEDVITVTEAA